MRNAVPVRQSLHLISKKDVDSFKSVVNHPVLSSFVKEIIYDTVHFDPEISRYDYFRQLCDNFWDAFTSYMPGPIPDIISGPKLALQSVNRCDHLFSRILFRKDGELYEIHKEDSYISAVYIEWQNNAIYEEWAMNEGTFLSTL